MANRILLIHDQRSVASALVQAFDERGFSSTAVETVDEALDYLCTGGKASVILYDGTRSGTTWLLGRAQEANPALLRIPLIALSPLNGDFAHSRSTTADAATSIDLAALMLIVNQLCRGDMPGSRQMSREP